MGFDSMHFLQDDERPRRLGPNLQSRCREATEKEKAAALAAEQAAKAAALAAWEAEQAAKAAEQAAKAAEQAAKAATFFAGLIGKNLSLDGVVAPVKRNVDGAIVALIEATWNGKPLGRSTTVVLFDPALGRTPNHGYSRGTDAEKFQSWASKQSKKL